MLTVTVQTQINGTWHDAARLTLHESDNTIQQKTAYFLDYAVEHLGSKWAPACSLRYPVELALTYSEKPWFGYLNDILPSGASYRWWIDHLGIADLPFYEQKVALLKNAVIAPVGNLRIKECVAKANEGVKSVQFTVNDVISYNRDFLSYAQQIGAASGGATGAGGEAPKLLLVQDKNGNISIDTTQSQISADSIYYLVKFPRGNNTQLDQDILRAEYHFYHELEALNVDTIATNSMRLIESAHGPSLWLPRFDITVGNNGKRHQYGLESIYSLIGKASGALKHQDVFTCLCDALDHTSTEERSIFAIEYIWRDLLNIVFANTDNHGRNMAVLKTMTQTRLAPVYDFAPMKFDPEVVTRTTTWGQPLEVGGDFDFPAIVASLNNINNDLVINALIGKAQSLKGLYSRLLQRGVPTAILHAPTARYQNIEEKLQQWGLS